MDEQPPILLGTGPDCDMDLGYRIECFTSPRVQFPCNDPIGIRPDTAFTFPASFSQVRTRYPRWYTIKTSAFSIERSSAVPGPTPPSSTSDLLRGEPASGGLKLEVTDGENNKFLVDIGQGRDLSVLSRGLSARIEAPPGSQRVEDSSLGLSVPAAGPFPFFICDAVVNVSIMDGIAPLGGRSGTLSRLYQVTAGAGLSQFKIPARAQRVQFSTFAPFGVDTPIARFTSNVTSPSPARLFYSSVVLPAGDTTTPFVDVPGDATGLELSQAFAYNLNAVWELSW